MRHVGVSVWECCAVSQGGGHGSGTQLISLSPCLGQLMWDQMWRSTINYGRKGLPIQCIRPLPLYFFFFFK